MPLTCLLICEKTEQHPETPHLLHTCTTAWVPLLDAPQAMLDAQRQGYEVVGLLTRRAQPRSIKGKRMLAVGKRKPQREGA